MTLQPPTRRRPRTVASCAAALIVLLLAASVAPADSPSPPPPADAIEVEVHHVPREDLRGAAPSAAEGTFVPVSEVAELVREAREAVRLAAERPADDTPMTATLSLAGTLADRLDLAGTIEFDAPGEGWSVCPLDDGTMPWTGQEHVDGIDAFLVRRDGRTLLLAQGPGRGTVRVRAALAAGGGRDVVRLEFGRFLVPSHLRFEIPEGLSLGSRAAPATLTAGTPSRLDVWPTTRLPAVLELNRAPTLRDPEQPALLELRRVVDVRGRRLHVVDDLVLAGLLEKGGERTLALPPGLRALEARGITASTTVSIRGDRLVVRAEERVSSLALTVTLVPTLDGREATLGTWSIAPAAETSLILIADDRFAPVLVDPPAALLPAGVSGDERRYTAWEPLPDLRVRLVERVPSLPVRARARLLLRSNQAQVEYMIEFGAHNPGEAIVVVPEEWVLIRVGAPGGGSGERERGEGNRWRIRWQDRSAEARLHYTIRRSGAWGERGATERFDTPFPVIEGLDIASTALSVTWADNLEVQLAEAVQVVADSAAHGGRPGGPTDPQGNRVAPPTDGQSSDPFFVTDNIFEFNDAWNFDDDSAAQTQVSASGERQQFFSSGNSLGQLSIQSFDASVQADRALDDIGATRLPGMFLATSGPAPRAVLSIRGREPVISATANTTLLIDEERARVRTALDYFVVFAPTHSFRVLLPPGTGAAVRIEGEGVRERTLEARPDADAWTIVTQQAVIGPYRLTLEWPLETPRGSRIIRAPEIRLEGMSSQRGYVVLEASETLRLRADATGLVETDVAAVPPSPWPRENRVLAAYSYIEPPFDLRIESERIQPEEGVDGYVTLATLTSTITVEGELFTSAAYDVVLAEASQFLDVVLPRSATLWSLLVDGQPARPSRRGGADGRPVLLVPMPPRGTEWRPVRVAVVYREELDAPARVRGFSLGEPRLPIPINKTVREVNLPPDLEFLSFGGAIADIPSTHDPVVSYLRTAHYPRLIILAGLSPARIGAWTVAMLVAVGAVVWVRRRLRERARRAAERAARPPRSTSMVTFLEILLVLLVLAVLASIATPNFLEAQVRSKVARVLSDSRSMSTAVASYIADTGVPPESLEVLSQGPVKYVSTVFNDPYSPLGGEKLRYLRGREAAERAAQSGMLRGQAVRDPASAYMIYSLGPDGEDDGAMVLYDPTNGTTSRGDVVRFEAEGFASARAVAGSSVNRLTGNAAHNATLNATPVDARVEIQRRNRMQGDRGAASAAAPEDKSVEGREAATVRERAAGEKAKAPGGEPMGEESELVWSYDYDPNAPDSSEAQPTTTAGVPFAPPPGTSAPSVGQQVAPPSGAAAGSGTRAGQAGAGAGTGSFRGGAQAQFGVAAARARAEGVLSLDIDLPGGWMSRRFETLDEDAHLQASLRGRSSFLRWQFVVWFGAAVALGVVALRAPRRYRVSFFAVVAVALLAPIAIPGAATAYFNALLRGALVSLLVPAGVAFAGWRRSARARHASNSRPTAAGATMILVAAIALGGADHAHAKGDGSWSPAAADRVPPARVVVPYDDATSPFEDEDPLAFISSAEFARLWDAAHPDPSRATLPAPFLASMTIDGRIDLATETCLAELSLIAANPGETPAALPLALGEAALAALASTPAGATLEAGPDGGLALRLPAHWSGTVRTQARIPCTVSGRDGRLRLTLPDVATGAWTLLVPSPDAISRMADHALRPARHVDGGTEFSGPIRAGLLDVAFTTSRVQGAAAGDGAAMYRVDISMSHRWRSLAWADWSASISLNATTSSTMLPGEITLPVDGGLALHSAKGDDVDAVVREGDVIRIRLRPAASTTVNLAGTMARVAAAEDSADSWRLQAIHLPAGQEGSLRLRLDVSDQIDLLGVAPAGLARETVRGLVPGSVSHQFSAAAAAWELSLAMRRATPLFACDLVEAIAPHHGVEHRLCSVRIEPRGGSVAQLTLVAPDGHRLVGAEGEGLAGAIQSGRTILLSFSPPAETPREIVVRGSAAAPAPGDAHRLEPLEVEGAMEVLRSLALFVPIDEELAEVDLAGATPRPPSARDLGLMESIAPDGDVSAGTVRAYRLAANRPLTLRTSVFPTQALVTAYNLATVADGLVTLESVVRAEPRRGRLREVAFDLLLPSPDPDVLTRLQWSSPIRRVRGEEGPDGVWHLVAELVAPSAVAVDLSLRLERAAATDAGSQTAIPAIVPPGGEGGRGFLLLRRTFEGELVPADMAGARSREAGEIAWPARESFTRRASDRAFELAAAPAPPAFTIVRHQRDEGLRAIVEMLRQRTILTADGVERHELDIVLQNQSEQYLRLALPAPRRDLTLFEVRVAGRATHWSFETEGGRDVLLVPLIRTGLLEPELAVRIAYVVEGRGPLGRGGTRRQQLPEVLGGVPVAQSALLLMLPSTHAYRDFEGTLNRAELVEIEAAETERRARAIERLSEVALQTTGEVQRQVLGKLGELNDQLESQVAATKGYVAAYEREQKKQSSEAFQKGEAPQPEADVRATKESISRAEIAQSRAIENTARLGRAVQEQAQVDDGSPPDRRQVQRAIQPHAPGQPPAPPQQRAIPVVAPPPPSVPPLEFPREGEVVAFRQLQGTGYVDIEFGSRRAGERRADLLLAVGLTALVGALTFGGRRLLGSRRNVGIALVVLGLGATAARAFLDVAIPAVIVGIVLLRRARRSR